MNSILSWLTFLVVLLAPGSSFAQEPSADFREMDRKLSTLESKMNQMDAAHEEILSKQATIKEELESLRIWIRRNRS